jgi:uncharacterized protein YoxC
MYKLKKKKKIKIIINLQGGIAMDNDTIIQKIAELSTKVDIVFQDVAELYKKYEKLEKDSNDNNTAVQTILVKLENLGTQMNEMNTTLKELKETPAKNWNTIITSLIGSIVTGAIGFAIARLTGK